jgi:hypothetical protein
LGTHRRSARCRPAGDLGVIADPDPEARGRALVEAYAADPNALNFKAVGYHFAYTLWLAAALGLAALVRRRGAWLANVAGVLAILGISTIPGFLIIDFLNSAMGRIVGVAEAVRVEVAPSRPRARPTGAPPGAVGHRGPDHPPRRVGGLVHEYERAA